MNPALAHPFFCLGDRHVAEVENDVSIAVLLDYPMAALMTSALER